MSQSVYDRVKAILDETPLSKQRQRAENDKAALRAIADASSELLGLNSTQAEDLYLDIGAAVAVKILSHYKKKCEHETTD